MDELHTAKELKKYNMADAHIAGLSKQYMALKVEGVNDQKGYELVHRARIEIKTKRVEIEKIRKALKADSIKFGDVVDTEAKRIKSLLSPIEEYLISQEKIVEDETKRIKAEKDRIEKERIEKEEAEKKRVEEEKQAKIREEQRIESERLEKIRIEQEEKEAKIKAEQEKIEAEKQEIAKQKERDKQEREKQAEIEQAKIDAVEKERLKEDQAKKDEELRLAMLPDKEKLFALADFIDHIHLPSLSHAQSHNVLNEAKAYLAKACEVLRGEA